MKYEIHRNCYLKLGLNRRLHGSWISYGFRHSMSATGSFGSRIISGGRPPVYNEWRLRSSSSLSRWRQRQISALEKTAFDMGRNAEKVRLPCFRPVEIYEAEVYLSQNVMSENSKNLMAGKETGYKPVQVCACCTKTEWLFSCTSKKTYCSENCRKNNATVNNILATSRVIARNGSILLFPLPQSLFEAWKDSSIKSRLIIFHESHSFEFFLPDV